MSGGEEEGERDDPAGVLDGGPAAVTLWDVAVVLGFCVYGVLFWLEKWQGEWPFVILGGDSGNILSWAVALNHPQQFIGDSALGDPSALAFYATVHVPLMRLLGPAVGDFGTAWMALLAPHVALQATGFYVLGRVLFRSRLWALLLAVITLILTWINLGTYWGAYVEPQPRFTFQAFLPFVLALAIHWRDRPSRWPAIMAAAGLLMYVHPVSAPAWGFAIWLGLWAGAPDGTTMWSRVWIRGLAAAVFLIVVAPFVYLYSGSHTESQAPLSEVASSEVAAAIEIAVPKPYRSVEVAVGAFRRMNSRGLRLRYWIGAGLGVVVLWVLGGRERALLYRVLMWTVGVVAVSIGLTWADQTYAAANDIPRLQVDLIRNIRYLVPLVLLLALWPLAAIDGRMRLVSAPTARRIGRLVAIAAGLLVTVAWAKSSVGGMTVEHSLACWREGAIVCRGSSHTRRAAMFDAIRDRTPAGARLVTTRSDLAPIIRMYSRRPVVHDWRDISVFLYARRERIPGWQVKVLAERRIRRLKPPAKRLAGYLQFARENGADFALVDSSYLPGSFPTGAGAYAGHEVPWRDEDFALVRVATHPDQ